MISNEGQSAAGKLSSFLDQLVDLLYYINDLFELRVAQLTETIATKLNHALLNLLSECFNPDEHSQSNSVPCRSTTHLLWTSMYFLSQIFIAIEEPLFVQPLLERLLRRHKEESAENEWNPNRILIMKSLSGNDLEVRSAIFMLYAISNNKGADPSFLHRSGLLPHKRAAGLQLEEEPPPPANQQLPDKPPFALAIKGKLVGVLVRSDLCLATLKMAHAFLTV